MRWFGLALLLTLAACDDPRSAAYSPERDKQFRARRSRTAVGAAGAEDRRHRDAGQPRFPDAAQRRDPGSRNRLWFQPEVLGPLQGRPHPRRTTRRQRRAAGVDRRHASGAAQAAAAQCLGRYGPVPRARQPRSPGRRTRIRQDDDRAVGFSALCRPRFAQRTHHPAGRRRRDHRLRRSGRHRPATSPCREARSLV